MCNNHSYWDTVRAHLRSDLHFLVTSGTEHLTHTHTCWGTCLSSSQARLRFVSGWFCCYLSSLYLDSHSLLVVWFTSMAPMMHVASLPWWLFPLLCRSFVLCHNSICQFSLFFPCDFQVLSKKDLARSCPKMFPLHFLLVVSFFPGLNIWAFNSYLDFCNWSVKGSNFILLSTQFPNHYFKWLSFIPCVLPVFVRSQSFGCGVDPWACSLSCWFLCVSLSASCCWLLQLCSLFWNYLA